MTPNYYIMKLPGENGAEFVNSIPFTPKDKKNLTGLLVARNDGDNYGELDALPDAEEQDRLRTDAGRSTDTTRTRRFQRNSRLWNSSGSSYSRGNMFVVPIEDSLLYIEPVYLEATNSSIPEVKRVIVAYGAQHRI